MINAFACESDQLHRLAETVSADALRHAVGITAKARRQTKSIACSWRQA